MSETMLHIPILLRAAVLGGAVLLPFAPVAQAQSGAETALSAQPFSIVAPFPPGGPVDVLSRILATGLNERYKQAAVVDNRTGANGNIGIDLVKRAAPTGHTLLVVPAGLTQVVRAARFTPMRLATSALTSRMYLAISH